MPDSVVASLRYSGNDAAGSYPASIIRFLLDNRDSFVVLSEETIAAVREAFNYYNVEADVNKEGLYRIRKIKGRDAVKLKYDVDEQSGLLILRDA